MDIVLSDLKTQYIGNTLIVLKDYIVGYSNNKTGDYIVIENVLSEYESHKEPVFKLSDGSHLLKSYLDSGTCEFLSY